MTQEDHPARQRSSQTFRWVAVTGSAVAVVLALVDGHLLLACTMAAMALGLLVEAARLDERSVTAKRLGQALAAVSGALSVFYFYTTIIS